MTRWRKGEGRRPAYWSSESPIISSRNSRSAYSHVSHSPRGDGCPQRGQVISVVTGEGPVWTPVACAVAEGGCGVELFHVDVAGGGATWLADEGRATGAGEAGGAIGAGVGGGGGATRAGCGGGGAIRGGARASAEGTTDASGCGGTTGPGAREAETAGATS